MYAQDQGISMLRALALVLDMSQGEAAYALRIVQSEGLVELRRRTGEGHVPARAVIHRGTPKEFRWTVCQACLTWPCLLERPIAQEGQPQELGEAERTDEQHQSRATPYASS